MTGDPASPAPDPQRTVVQDAEHLKLLAIGHYVLGGLIALISLFPMIHFVLGLAMATGALPMEGNSSEELAVARMVGCLLVVLPGLFILIGFATAGAVVAAGRFLQEGRNWTFCLVVAAVLCMFAPFGTVVGVLTILVLMRDSVKQRFGTTF